MQTRQLQGNPNTKKCIDAELSRKQEGVENHIDLTIGTPATIPLLLNFLYTMQYEHKTVEESLVTDANVYVAADFYDIPALKPTITAHYSLLLSKIWDTIHFSDAIEIIYANLPSSDRHLRDLSRGHYRQAQPPSE